MKHIIVLGAGMVGSTIAADMAEKHKVTLADLNRNILDKVKKKHSRLDILPLDVTDKKTLQGHIKPFDLVICAVPGFLGFQTLTSIIEAGKNVIDISFFSENALLNNCNIFPAVSNNA